MKIKLKENNLNKNNELCKGCSCYKTFKLHHADDKKILTSRCDYILNNKSNFLCPCSICLIKVMCYKICPTWEGWRDALCDKEGGELFCPMK